MERATWTDEDTARAKAIWDEYQEAHDLSDRTGQTAGIDPRTGRVWFGESIPDIVRQRDAEGLTYPFYAVRVGYDYYQRKGLTRGQGAWIRAR